MLLLPCRLLEPNARFEATKTFQKKMFLEQADRRVGCQFCGMIGDR